MLVDYSEAKDVFVLLKGKEKALKAGEEPPFTWFKSGQEFDPDDRFKVLFKDEEDTLALVFLHINPEDAGEIVDDYDNDTDTDDDRSVHLCG